MSSLVTFLQLLAKFPSTAANNLHKFVLQPIFAFILIQKCMFMFRVFMSMKNIIE